MRFSVVCIVSAALVSLLAAQEPAATDSANVLPGDGLNLPAHYRQLISARAIIDRHAGQYYQVVPGAPEPMPLRPRVRPGASNGVSRVVTPRLDPATLAYRARFPERFLPLRGFRAPILADATNQPPPVLLAARLTPAEVRAAEHIRQRLAFDGLLRTLVSIVEVMGPDSLVAADAVIAAKLAAIGFPADLLACFPLPPEMAARETNVLRYVVSQLALGTPVEKLRSAMEAIPFRVPPEWIGFQVAGETGETALGLVRMQFGGGFHGGIVPGDSLDVIGQLLRLLPEPEFLISVPSEYSRPFQTLALPAWGLRNRNRITIIEEPFRVEAWAQDGSKAGRWIDPTTGRSSRMTLVPRYASRDEGISSCLAGESFLMDGLAAAGEHVRQFPLLFQGGNLLAVPVPAAREKLLLLNEAEVFRNLALGLTRDQVIELFRRGFGVGRCVVLPAVSYHLDFDLSVRLVDGEPVALVNDPESAARTMLRLGVKSLADGLFLDGELARRLIADLQSGSGHLAHAELERWLATQRESDGRFRAELAQRFVAAPSDSATLNFQCFLQSLDLLAVALGDLQARPADVAPDRLRFLNALRQVDDARRAQIAAIKQLNWRVVPVPSMPNLLRSINYLNGVHHPGAFLMPAFGGYHTPLDQEASAAIGGIATGLVVKPVQCAELQRYLGGVHCATVVYPDVP